MFTQKIKIASLLEAAVMYLCVYVKLDTVPIE